MGYYDDNGIYHHEESDPADPGGGFSALLNLISSSISPAVSSMVAAAIGADPTIEAAVLEALENVDIVVGTEVRAPQIITTPTSLYSVVDIAGRQSDLSIRADGQMSGFAVDRLAPRIGQRLGVTTPHDAIMQDGAPVPVTPDMGTWVGVGSSSLDLFSGRFASLAASYGADYINLGDGGVAIQHSAAQLGSHPALVTFPNNEMPASGGVVVTVSNVPASSEVRPFTGTIRTASGALVEGTLSSTSTEWTFTRTAAGTVQTVAADTPFIPAQSDIHRAAVILFWAGKGNFSSTNAGRDTLVIQYMREMIEWLRPLHKRIIVFGHFADTGTPAVSMERDQIIATNAQHAAAYSPYYVDVSAYITGSQVWADTGITPTQDDLDQQAIGNKPVSLSRTSEDTAHLSGVATQALIDNRAKPIINATGWYPLVESDIDPEITTGLSLMQRVPRAFTEGPRVFTLAASDTFSGAAAPSIAGRVTDSALGGEEYSYLYATSNSWAISGSGQLVRGASNNQSFAGIDLGLALVGLEVQVAELPSAGTLSIDVRRESAASAAGRYYVRISSDGSAALVRYDTTGVVLMTLPQVADGVRVRVIVGGATIRIYFDGVEVALYESAYSYQSATLTGVSVVGSGTFAVDSITWFKGTLA